MASNPWLPENALLTYPLDGTHAVVAWFCESSGAYLRLLASHVATGDLKYL